MARPLVSVCIPTYNYGGYICAAIESILSQTYRNFELIIIDDCSRDNTEEIVHKYVAQHRNIKFHKNIENIGMVENWNLCLKHAQGDLVKIMGADDMLEPACLEKSVALIDANPTVSLVVCARLLVDKDDRPIQQAVFFHTQKIISGIKIIKKCFFDANLIGEPVAVLFKKKDALRGFDPRYRQLTDLEMWFHLLEQGDCAFIPEPLCKFRVHERQTTKENVRSLRFIADEFLLYHDYIRKEYLGETIPNTLHWKFKLCFTIWMQQFAGLDIKVIRSEIRKYFPLSIFYPLAVLKIVKDRIAKRIRTFTVLGTR